MADWTGRKVGRVQIKDFIARGGMAEIYLGEHEVFGQIAVKVMRGLLERDPSQLARFKREAEVIGELQHPNIVRLVDYVVEDETPCLVMEYIPGPSLAIYMKALHERKQRIPIAVVAQILKSVASALDYAHSNGIIHRDIKPANVLLRSASQPITIHDPLPLDVEPVLTDFGLVRLVDSTQHTTTGSVSGTPAYMSPEQARGEKVDHRTDIYSLGVMLYEMLAGVVPFQSDTTFGMLMKHINETPPPIKGLSVDMYALLERALAKDPALRYESAGALANEFLALFNGQTISPGTLHMAEMARKVAEAGFTPKPPPPAPARFRWARLGIEALLVLSLGFFIIRFASPNGLFSIFAPATNTPTPTLTPTATPIPRTPTPTPIDPNIAVGRARFSYNSSDNDRITFRLNDIPTPAANTHLEAWLVYDDQTIRDAGQVTFDASGISVQFTDPNGTNLVDGLSQVEITKEQDSVSIAKPTGEVIYSSVLPPQSKEPIHNLIVADANAPNQYAAVLGLYYYNGAYVNISINGDKDYKVTSLMELYQSGNKAQVDLRVEQLINQIVGNQSELYKDYNKNGIIETDLNDSVTFDGYGALPNGSQSGYVQETLTQAKLAAEASDATDNIRTNSEQLKVCTQNMQTRLNQILQDSLKLTQTTFGPDMEPIITELNTLGNSMLHGNDTNGNGQIDQAERVSGECGADGAYDDATFMADLLLYPGADRIPPTGK
jgi:protein kinase-like protein